MKRLLAVEALGSTTVICTDKTGTLTEAEMTVQLCWESGRRVDSVEDLLRIAALCSNARLVADETNGGTHVLGDPTEGALLIAAAKAAIDLRAEERAAPRVFEFPFDSTRKLMTTVHRAPGRHRTRIVTHDCDWCRARAARFRCAGETPCGEE